MLSSCGCGTHPDGTDGTFKWSGCDDNVRWGVQFAKQFVKLQNPMGTMRTPSAAEYGDDGLPTANANDDAMSREQAAVAIVDQHNYKIGRKVSGGGGGAGASFQYLLGRGEK